MFSPEWPTCPGDIRIDKKAALRRCHGTNAPGGPYRNVGQPPFPEQAVQRLISRPRNRRRSPQI